MRSRLNKNFVTLVALSLSFSAGAADDRPNILVILADDLGYSDISPYGSEISTPTLSALAEEGVTFTNYHTAASCAPSRSMLLTGVDNHRNGVPNIPEALPPEQEAHENYRGVLGENVVTVATLLEEAGYHTYLSGKWHLGMQKYQLPSNRGFEKTVAMMDTGADNWEQRPYLPIYEKANWYENGQELTLPEDFYSSEYLVDRMIGFIEAQNDDRPFFAYLPFLAVHLPVQSPREFTERYMDSYNDGWDAIRESRRTKAVELGLVPAETEMVVMSTTDDWEALSDERKKYERKRMAVYAGMVEAMDFHIGRLVAYLKESGQYDNTVILFTSDNGSEASGAPNPQSARNRFTLGRMGYKNDYETMGEKGSFSSISPSFASAAASPLAFYKFFAGEGGLRVPLIVSGKPLSIASPINHSLSYVTDIAATVLDLAQVEHPGSRYAGKNIEPMIGRSILPLVSSSDSIYGPEDAIGYEVAGNAALFMGDYKIVLNREAPGDGVWHLYNIVSDPGEVNDLAGKMPEKLEAMIHRYEQYAEENNVLPVPVGYKQRTQVALKGLRGRAGDQLLALLLTFLTVVVVWQWARLTRNN